MPALAEVVVVLELAVEDASLIGQQCVEELVLEVSHKALCALHNLHTKVWSSDGEVSGQAAG
ncbi:hypothetical protein D3C73_1421250 [compost metagenome]